MYTWDKILAWKDRYRASVQGEMWKFPPVARSISDMLLQEAKEKVCLQDLRRSLSATRYEQYSYMNWADYEDTTW